LVWGLLDSNLSSSTNQNRPIGAKQHFDCNVIGVVTNDAPSDGREPVNPNARPIQEQLSTMANSKLNCKVFN
jgi:hypothetical protein